MVFFIHHAYAVSYKAGFPEQGQYWDMVMEDMYDIARVIAERTISKAQEKKAIKQASDSVVAARKRLITSQSYTQGMCQSFGGGMTNENAHRIDEMNINIKNLFMDTRASLSGLWFEAQGGSPRDLVTRVIASTKVSDSLTEIGYLAEAE